MQVTSTGDWLTHPAQAHREWRQSLELANRTYAAQSQRLYISLFGRFSAWLATQPCNLQNLSQTDLAKFVETLRGRGGRVAANRTQRTYVAEIERVLAHLKGMGVREDNPAQSLLETLRITTPLRPRSIHIPNDDTRALYLQSLSKLSPEQMVPEAIQTVAMNLLMLDCGFTLKELQKIVLKHLHKLTEGEITAPGHRLLLTRPVPLTTEAKVWLQRWLTVRQTLYVVTPAQYKSQQSAVTGQGIKSKAKAKEKLQALAGQNARSKVFVSFAGKTGKPVGLRAMGLAIDHVPESTIYLGAQAVLQAGRDLSKAECLTMRHKGPQALRNRCCATKLAQGMPTGEIVAFMGLHRADQVWAMSRAMKTSLADFRLG